MTTDAALEGGSTDAIEPILAEIETHVRTALNVMLDRAMEGESLEIADRKDEETDLEPSGLLQDCEFGMILLQGRRWLAQREALNGSIADHKAVERLVVQLVARVVDRAIAGLRDRFIQDKGGGLQGSAVFFTGEPYTKYRERKITYYSANIDSAMITLGFLLPALEDFDDALANSDLSDLNEKCQAKLSHLGDNLRDAALFVCNEGIRYARACAVQSPDGFDGFSSDPGSVTPDEPGFVTKTEDRLFYSWTASETINDLGDWSGYLERLAAGAPSEELAKLLQEAIEGIESLGVLLQETAKWCEKSFLERFRKLEPLPVRNVVTEIEGLGENIEQQQEDELRQLAAHVQHVYHLSQYAAIRSLAPAAVTPAEVGDIFQQLHSLVTQDIINSQLDRTEHPRLFECLTRQYDLGNSNATAEYLDDAFYPLVVRSLSALLSRTIADISLRGNTEEVEQLARDYRRLLYDHYLNLVQRRPRKKLEGGEEEPGVVKYLWSFADRQPYVFYAAQRTVFALISYADCVVIINDFLANSGGGKKDKDPARRLAEMLAEHLIGPAARKYIAELAVHPPTLPNLADASSQLPLPSQEWAAETIYKWLEELTQDFKDSQIAANLRRSASHLMEIRRYALEYEPRTGLAPRQKKGVDQLLPDVREKFQQIVAFEGFGGKLAELQAWSTESLLPILFDYVFREFVGRPERSLQDVLDKEASDLIWSTLNEATGQCEAIRKIDGTD